MKILYVKYVVFKNKPFKIVELRETRTEGESETKGCDTKTVATNFFQNTLDILIIKLSEYK